MTPAFWWERMFACSAALEANPADRLAYREICKLARVKDSILWAYGEQGLYFLGASLQEGIPQ